MKKNLNLTFYKSLINSDFSLLALNINRHTNYITSDSQINSYNRLKTLDVFQLLKSCKQFIRILQFIKSNKSAEINIILSNKQYFYLLKNYFLEYPQVEIINIHYLINKSKKLENAVSFDIFIGDSIIETSKDHIRKAVMNKKLLLQNINARVEFSQKGVYKIYNDTLDFKKIVFLISLLNLVCQNKLSSNAVFK